MGAKDMASHAATMRIPFRVLHDPELALVKQLGLTRLSEVGRARSRLERPVPRSGRRPERSRRDQARRRREHYLADAVDAMLAGRPVETPTPPGGGLQDQLRSAGAKSQSELTYPPRRRAHPAAPLRVVPSRGRGGADAAGNATTTWSPTPRWSRRWCATSACRRIPASRRREFANDERLTADERRTLLEWLARRPRGGRPDGRPGADRLARPPPLEDRRAGLRLPHAQADAGAGHGRAQLHVLPDRRQRRQGIPRGSLDRGDRNAPRRHAGGAPRADPRVLRPDRSRPDGARPDSHLRPRHRKRPAAWARTRPATKKATRWSSAGISSDESRRRQDGGHEAEPRAPT